MLNPSIGWSPLLWAAVALLVAVLGGYVVHRILWFSLGKAAARTDTVLDDSLTRHCRRPTIPVVPVLIFYMISPLFRGLVSDGGLTLIRNLLTVVLIIASAWTLTRLTDVAQDFLLRRYDISASDNLRARAVHTQFRIIRRIAIVIIGVLTFGVLLMSFENLRQIGTGLLASAGLVGLVMGLAAQRTLSNLLAGIQIAITQPIRLDDVVIVEGEWGRIEEITLTFVVVKIWDRRRLVLPIGYFLEKPFQNWTRVSADILGTVYLSLDHAVPVEEIRAELKRIVQGSEDWDGEVCGVQVTDTSPQGIEVRALVSAADASKAWDLRCHVREKLIEFVREKYPHALPRFRAEIHEMVKKNRASTISR